MPKQALLYISFLCFTNTLFGASAANPSEEWVSGEKGYKSGIEGIQNKLYG